MQFYASGAAVANNTVLYVKQSSFKWHIGNFRLITNANEFYEICIIPTLSSGTSAECSQSEIRQKTVQSRLCCQVMMTSITNEGTLAEMIIPPCSQRSTVMTLPATSQSMKLLAWVKGGAVIYLKQTSYIRMYPRHCFFVTCQILNALEMSEVMKKLDLIHWGGKFKWRMVMDVWEDMGRDQWCLLPFGEIWLWRYRKCSVVFKLIHAWHRILESQSMHFTCTRMK